MIETNHFRAKTTFPNSLLAWHSVDRNSVGRGGISEAVVTFGTNRKAQRNILTFGRDILIRSRLASVSALFL